MTDHVASEAAPEPPYYKQFSEVLNANWFKCEVLHTSPLGARGYTFMSLLDEDMAVVYTELGKGKFSLRRVRVDTGEELQGVDVECLDGMAVVELGGKQTVAMTMKKRQEVVFRDALDLSVVVHSFNTKEGTWDDLFLTTLGKWIGIPEEKTTLLALDDSTHNFAVYDCCGSEPKRAAVSDGLLEIHEDCRAQGYPNSLTVRREGCRDMALISKQGKPVVGLTWNTHNQWRETWVCGGYGRNSRCLTTDGCGHVFVTDLQEMAVLVLELRWGAVQGKILEGMGLPQSLEWCSSRQSLVLTHSKDDDLFISVVRLEADLPVAAAAEGSE